MVAARPALSLGWLKFLPLQSGVACALQAVRVGNVSGWDLDLEKESVLCDIGGIALLNLWSLRQTEASGYASLRT